MKKINSITSIVEQYFAASHFGDVQSLEKIIRPTAIISGILGHKFVCWTRNDFIERIKSNAVAKDNDYNKQILSVDITLDIAVVKAKVIVGDLEFIDYLSLVCENNLWTISNKTFTQSS